MRRLDTQLAEAGSKHGDRLVLLCSFQKEESVLVEAVMRVAPDTRVGTKASEDEARDLSLPGEFGLDTMNEFIDWSRNVPFQVIRGEGECAV